MQEEKIMGSKASEFVSAAGTVFEIVQALAGTVRDLGGTDSNLRKVLFNLPLRRRMARLLFAPVMVQPGSTYTLTMDPVASYDELLVAGSYVEVADFSRLKVQGRGAEKKDPSAPYQIVVEVVRMCEPSTKEEVLAEFEYCDLRSATFAELLTLGAQCPDTPSIQALDPLGTTGEGCVYPVLGRNSKGRYAGVFLSQPGFRASESYLYAAVRK